MAEFKIRCPHCDAELLAEDRWLGIEVQCPSCRRTFIAEKKVPKSPDAIPKQDYKTRCPHCGAAVWAKEEWSGRLAQCPRCRQNFVIAQETSKGRKSLPRSAASDRNPSSGNPAIALGHRLRQMAADTSKKLGAMYPQAASASLFSILKEKNYLAAILIVIVLGSGILIFGNRNSLPGSSHRRGASSNGKTICERVLGKSPKKAAAQKKSDGSGTSSTTESKPEPPKRTRFSTSGRYASKISGVMSDFSYHNTMSNNINQQICNGTYRTVDLLCLIAKKLDE